MVIIYIELRSYICIIAHSSKFQPAIGQKEMSRPVTIEKLDFAALVKPGDRVLWGQACAEPVTLTRHLLAQRERVGQFAVFLGIPASDSVQAHHADYINFSSYCGTGLNHKLGACGMLDIVPCHYSALPDLISDGKLAVDVVLLQLSPPDADGNCSLSTAVDYLPSAIQSARTVIAEINDQAPSTVSDFHVHIDYIDYFVETSRPVLELPSRPPGERELAIARQVAQLIDDGDTLQMGIGTLPEAIFSQLKDHRHLGIHSGTIGDKVAELMQAGVITNERKSVDTGHTIATMLMGTRTLYDFAHRNPLVQLRPSTYTHDYRVLSQQDRLTSINAALEVDLTGQVNAEEAAGKYLGAVGGAVDFSRAANRARGGKSIMTLPSMAGESSRIVSRLQGPVSTPRSDCGIVVTEFGYADLRGLGLSERIKRMIAIAHPDVRADLEQQADNVVGARHAGTH